MLLDCAPPLADVVWLASRRTRPYIAGGNTADPSPGLDASPVKRPSMLLAASGERQPLEGRGPLLVFVRPLQRRPTFALYNCYIASESEPAAKRPFSRFTMLLTVHRLQPPQPVAVQQATRKVPVTAPYQRCSSMGKTNTKKVAGRLELHMRTNAIGYNNNNNNFVRCCSP